ncbi:rRNA methyltransferase [Gordoniibacillus kamchatkensis]|uniref:rRNA methyltransferase n=1 Tax=Gordoniibacillus kamchatkensis TaxID=1590651 RepID=A0ABR5AQ75_9BACL|nr:RNA methyltransferase [Paenibacillus sp. VKM B-2647]KIL42507.1 rRNA methyltransferase [Paenibacillus sp. VKM B-2647]
MPASEITSVQNPRVKEWAQLRERKGRDSQQRYLVEGPHLVEEALRSRAPVVSVLYALGRSVPPGLRELAEPGVEWIAVSEAVLAKLADTQTPQGVLAVVERTPFSAEQFFRVKRSLVVVLDAVQDPGNVGTIIRCADAVGADGVVLGRGTADLYNPKTIRSTMGSLFHLPIVEADLGDILPRASEAGACIVGTSLQAARSCYETDLTQPVWLVFGNEGQGMSARTASLVTDPVIIPMHGQAESLNVAMAATVLLFEASRQRRHARG